MIRRYDHLFFDLDHTLWDFPANSYKALQLAIQKFELHDKLPSFDEFFEVYEQINLPLWNLYRENKITKLALSEQRFSESLGHFGISNIDWLGLNDCYLDFMHQQTALYPQALETLEYLKKCGYQMHIITNGFKEVQRLKIKSSGLDKYFDRVFISEEVQSPKPERAIFEYAVKSCNAKKTRSIMVGDNWEVDIVGALNFGIDQIMFLNNESNSVPDDIQIKLKDIHPGSFILQKRNKTYFVQSLEELRGIL